MNKLYLNYLLILFVSFLTIIGCSTDDEIIESTQKIEDKNTFAIFSQSSKIQGKRSESTIDYANGFAVLLQKYDSIHNTNISGLVNSTNIVEHKKNSQQNVIVESKDFYIETRLHSQVITENNGNKYVMFPLIKDNKVDKLIVGLLSDKETYLGFYKIDHTHPLYNKNIDLFKNAFIKKNSLQSKTGEDCGFEGQPSCELQEVVIIVSPKPIDWPIYYPWVEGDCKKYNNCEPSSGGGGANISTPCDQLNTNNETANEVLNSKSVKDRVGLLKENVDTHPNERGFVIIKNENGSYEAVNYREGDTTSLTLNIPFKNSTYVLVGIFHTHPPIGAYSFSAADFYTFAGGYMSNDDMIISFLLGPNKNFYSLSITDLEKFKNFLNNYPKDQFLNNNTNGWNTNSSIGKSYVDAYDKLTASGMDANSAHELANAYVLDKYDTGITMSKSTSTENGFKGIQTKEKDGEYSKTDDCLL